MITIEQVKLLEEKVESLINVVKSLYRERDLLKGTVAQNEKRIEELESVLHSFEVSQAKIEESVMNALNQLDVFESSVAHESSSSTNSSANVYSDGFSLSGVSDSNQVEKNSSNEDVLQKTEVDDSDKQMDIF